MNNARRKQIKDAIKDLDIGTLEAMMEELESAQSDEQEYLDNMPESLQGGEKGEAAEAAIDALETAIDALETAIEALGEVEGRVEEATQ